MIRLVLTVALAAVATPVVTTPAFAAPATERAHTPQQVSDALKAGCSVQAVHTPAGKNGQQSAIVHCKGSSTVETASRDSARASKTKVAAN